MSDTQYCDACGSFRLAFRIYDGRAILHCKICEHMQPAWKEIWES